MSASGDIPAALRIVDANANRAREALRVLEDYARFALDDAHLSGRCKQARHALQQALQDLAGQQPQAPWFLYRDTAADVGTRLSSPTEQQRDTCADVLLAAANRLSEALRVLEEYGKQLDVGFASQIEKLRYDCYTLSSHLMRRARPAAEFTKVALYVLITEVLCRKDWYETAEQTLTAGAGALQLREKQLSDRVLLERARKLRRLCDHHQALLIMNDRADLAALAHADGVHLGQEDLSVAEARRILGPGGLVGVSTHTLQQAEQALGQGPDYLAVGPMFASSTKPQEHIAGPQTLDAVRRLTTLPLVAIGGITAAQAASLAAADVLAVCSAIISAADVSQATRRFLPPGAP